MEYDSLAPAPFVVLVHRGKVKIIKNPRLTVGIPFWLQEFMLNRALETALPPEPLRSGIPAQTRAVAEVVRIEALREQREARGTKGTGVGT